MDDLTARIEALEAKFAQIDTEVDAIQAIHQNKEKINTLNQTVTILTRTVKALFIAVLGAGLITYGDSQLQDDKLGNDEPGLWVSRGGIAIVLYSAIVVTNQEAIVMSTLMSGLSTINPWKK